MLIILICLIIGFVLGALLYDVQVDKFNKHHKNCVNNIWEAAKKSAERETKEALNNKEIKK